MLSLFFLGLCVLGCRGALFAADAKPRKIVTAKSLVTDKAVIQSFKKVGELAPNQTSREFTPGRAHTTPGMESHGPLNYIVNGEKASRREQNYVITIQIYYGDAWYHVCGGAILSTNKVITAAHCMRWWGYNDHSPEFDYRVGAGWYDLSQGLLNVGSQTFSVRKIHRHQGYKYRGPNVDSGIQPYDLAVITLDGHLEFDDRVKSIEPASFRETFADEQCDIIGWGDTENGYPTILHKSQMTVMGQSLCKQFWKIGQARIYNVELCTWDWPDRLSSTCSGDSGGPLICRGKLAGIVAWGLTYCNGCFPSVNTRISAFSRWIIDQMNED